MEFFINPTPAHLISNLFQPDCYGDYIAFPNDILISNGVRHSSELLQVEIISFSKQEDDRIRHHRLEKFKQLKQQQDKFAKLV